MGIRAHAWMTTCIETVVCIFLCSSSTGVRAAVRVVVQLGADQVPTAIPSTYAHSLRLSCT